MKLNINLLLLLFMLGLLISEAVEGAGKPYVGTHYSPYLGLKAFGIYVGLSVAAFLAGRESK